MDGGCEWDRVASWVGLFDGVSFSDMDVEVQSPKIRKKVEQFGADL